jgi:hypothetical protein
MTFTVQLSDDALFRFDTLVEDIVRARLTDLDEPTLAERDRVRSEVLTEISMELRRAGVVGEDGRFSGRPPTASELESYVFTASLN